MREARNRAITGIMRMILVASLILSTGMTALTARAAANPSIAAAMKIGTGSIVANNDNYYSKNSKNTLNVSNAVKNATYSFIPSNPKILAVKASGSTAYLTGLKAGTATITCSQKLNGATTRVGTCSVTVVNAKVYQDSIPELPLGTGSPEVIQFAYRNNDATYTYVSSSKSFSIKENIKKFDNKYFISHTYTAKAAGTFTVTVKETYNKTTRVVGKVNYIIKKDFALQSLECNFDAEEAVVGGDPVTVEVSKIPEYAPGTIKATSSNPKVAKVSSVDKNGLFDITPVSAGTVKITVTCGKITQTQTFTITKAESSDENSDEDSVDDSDDSDDSEAE